MTPQINNVLSQIREKLDLEESAWGPDMHQQVDDESHLSGKPGTGMAVNKTDIVDAVEMYLGQIVDGLLKLYDVDESAAEGLIFTVADQMASDGMLPPTPGEDAGPDDLSKWMGKAKSMGLEAAVMQAARDRS